MGCVCGQAIAAMLRALQADPENLEVLLSLGVSHTNELDQEQALGHLSKWLMHHPVHGAVASGMVQPGEMALRGEQPTATHHEPAIQRLRSRAVQGAPPADCCAHSCIDNVKLWSPNGVAWYNFRD